MSTITEAVRRATIAAAHRAGVGFAALDTPTQALHLDVTRAGLAAALDVEEMARVMFVARYPWSNWDAPAARSRRAGVVEEATALRAAILGDHP